MRDPKRLIYVFPAAAILIFVGAGPASATVICENNQETGCTSKQAIGAENSFSLVSGSTATLSTTAGILEDTCSSSTVTSKVTNAGNSTTTVVTSIANSSLTWGGCTDPTKTLTGGEGETHHISGTTNGTGTAKGFAVTVSISGLDCAYGAGTGIDTGFFKPGVGGKDGVLQGSVVIKRNNEHSIVFCPETAKFSASYTQTSTTPIYIAAN